MLEHYFLILRYGKIMKKFVVIVECDGDVNELEKYINHELRNHPNNNLANIKYTSCSYHGLDGANEIYYSAMLIFEGIKCQ